MTGYEVEQVKMAEQLDSLNQTLGDKLTERGLRAIQNQAMLKAAAAETGTAGGTTSEAIQEAFMTEHFDRANIIAETKNKQKAILTSMDLSRVKLESDLETLSSGMPVVDTNPVLSALTGALGVAAQAFDMMTPADRVSIFGITPSPERHLLPEQPTSFYGSSRNEYGF